MNFPQSVSFTITNRCNLRCQMCGQWSQEGYIRCQPQRVEQEMALADWQLLVDELAAHKTPSVLLRGGETFLYPHIAELLEYIHDCGLFISIDTNGTRLKDYADLIARLGKIHLTISLDGPEAVHDAVRGVKGTYARIREGLAALKQAEEKYGTTVGKSLNYTISPYSLSGLGGLPAAARELGVGIVCIVPYYYFPAAVGQAYEQELQSVFDCQAYSWVGFHHEESGVPADVFQAEYRRYKAELGNLTDFPYMAFNEEEYRAWFADAVTPVGLRRCRNVEKLIDIQPNGEANFCVDFPDYVLGNVREATIEEIWNGERAERFRAYRREHALPICQRCGAKYMSEME